MCTSEPVSLESSAAACAARRAPSEPSVAKRIFVGKMLTGVTSSLSTPFHLAPLCHQAKLAAALLPKPIHPSAWNGDSRKFASLSTPTNQQNSRSEIVKNTAFE